MGKFRLFGGASQAVATPNSLENVKDGPEQAEPCGETRVFSALSSGLKKMAEWLMPHQIEAVAREATGIYWQQPWDMLVETGLDCRLLQT